LGLLVAGSGSIHSVFHNDSVFVAELSDPGTDFVGFKQVIPCKYLLFWRPVFLLQNSMDKVYGELKTKLESRNPIYSPRETVVESVAPATNPAPLTAVPPPPPPRSEVAPAAETIVRGLDNNKVDVDEDVKVGHNRTMIFICSCFNRP